MKDAGLMPLSGEWWHFDDRDYVKNHVQVISGVQIGIYGPNWR
jgi:hypothetical protein